MDITLKVAIIGAVFTFFAALITALVNCIARNLSGLGGGEH